MKNILMSQFHNMSCTFVNKIKIKLFSEKTATTILPLMSILLGPYKLIFNNLMKPGKEMKFGFPMLTTAVLDSELKPPLLGGELKPNLSDIAGINVESKEH